jgi:CRISPR-associated protein Cas5t
MEANCTVELVAESPGDFVGEVVVKTELNIFSLSVSAKVLPAAEAEAVSPAGVSASAATDQLSSSGQL